MVQYRKEVRRLLLKEKKKRKKISELGLDYDFPGYRSKVQTSTTTHIHMPRHVVFDE